MEDAMLKVLNFVSRKSGQNKKDTTADLQKRLDELSILNKMSIALSSGQDLYHLLRLLLEELKKLFVLDEFYIGIYNPETETVSFPIYFTDGRFIEVQPRNLRKQPGLTGAVIFSEKTLYIPDQNDPEVIQQYQPQDTGQRRNRSYIGIPLMLNNKVIGILSVQSIQPNIYTAQQIQLLETIAAQSAFAIEKARLFSELQDELEQRKNLIDELEIKSAEAETLHESLASIIGTFEFSEIIQRILDQIKRVIPYDTASVWRVEGNHQKLIGGRDLPPEFLIPDHELIVSETNSGLPVVRGEIPYALYNNVQEQRADFREPPHNYINSWLALPLKVKGTIIGLICLDGKNKNQFTTHHAKLAVTFANQVAIATDKALIFQEQNRRSKIIEALAEIANEIATTRDVIPALEKISQRALELLNANHVAIYLLQEDNVTLKPVTALGTYRTELLSHVVKAGEGITGNIFLNATPEIINDISSDHRRIRVPGTPADDAKFETLMSCPLILRGKSIGTINVWKLQQDGLFTETELNFLVSIANQASICIESGKLFQETNRQAQESAAIAEVIRDISSTLQLDMVLERIASYGMKLLHARTSAVYLSDPDNLRLHAIAALGLDAKEIKDYPLTLGSGILGNIALQNSGEIVNNPIDDPRAIIVKGTEQIPFEHIMGVPILLKDKHMGLLAVWRFGVGTEFTPRELEFLTSMARQAAVAIENARLYSEAQQELIERERAEQELSRLNLELEQRVEHRTIQLQEANLNLSHEKVRLEKYNRQRELMADMTDLLQASLSMEEASQIISTHLKLLFPNQDGALYLVTPSNTFEPVAIWGEEKSLDVIYGTNDCWGLRRGKPYRFGVGSPNPPCAHIGEEKPFYSLCIPLSAQGEGIGNLHISTRNNQDAEFVSEEEQRFIETIGDSISLAIANLRLREKLHFEAIRDGLTGLFNRRYLDETLPREIHRAERNNHPISVLMFDIDHFKKFNDTFGHDAGDVVLKSLAGLMLTGVRESDIACKYGGEEFTIILPDTPIEVAARRAESLRQEVSTMELHHNGHDLGKVTISIGVATYPQHGTTRDTLIKSADEASYKAKETGRNRVIVCQ
jgi:diguanylate cyclase (GGDEF)-like protein